MRALEAEAEGEGAAGGGGGGERARAAPQRRRRALLSALLKRAARAERGRARNGAAGGGGGEQALAAGGAAGGGAGSGAGQQRATLADHLRARVGGALCRHALAGTPCALADCPYAHALPVRGASQHAGTPPARPRAPAEAAGGGGRGPMAAAAPAPDAPAAAAYNRPDRGVSVYRRPGAAERPAAGVLYVELGGALACAREMRLLGQHAHTAAPGARAREPAASAAAGADGAGGADSISAQRVPYDHGRDTISLHDDTLHALADGLSRCPARLHARVLEACAHAQGAGAVHESIAAAWEAARQLDAAAASAAAAPTPTDSTAADAPLRADAPRVGGAGDASRCEHAHAPSGASSVATGAAAPGTAGAPASSPGALAPAAADDSAAGVEAELARAHAHLRRQIRHGLQLMVQESNPHSYYAHVEHHFS